MFGAGNKMRPQEEFEKQPVGEELLLKSKEFLKNNIDQELLFSKKECRKNRGVALRRKKLYEKHLQYIDCSVKAVMSTHEYIDIANKVTALIKDIPEVQNVAEDMLDVSFGVEFEEDELLAELERLENEVDEKVEDITEEKVPCSQVSPTTSPSHHPVMTEEDEVEEALQYLRHWANEPV